MNQPSDDTQTLDLTSDRFRAGDPRISQTVYAARPIARYLRTIADVIALEDDKDTRFLVVTSDGSVILGRRLKVCRVTFREVTEYHDIINVDEAVPPTNERDAAMAYDIPDRSTGEISRGVTFVRDVETIAVCGGATPHAALELGSKTPKSNHPEQFDASKPGVWYVQMAAEGDKKRYMNCEHGDGVALFQGPGPDRWRCEVNDEHRGAVDREIHALHYESPQMGRCSCGRTFSLADPDDGFKTLLEHVAGAEPVSFEVVAASGAPAGHVWHRLRDELGWRVARSNRTGIRVVDVETPS